MQASSHIQVDEVKQAHALLSKWLEQKEAPTPIVEPPSSYFTDLDNPITAKAGAAKGKPGRLARLRFRAWLKAHNVPHYKAGHRTLARREDVDDTIMMNPATSPKPVIVDDDVAALEAAGVRVAS